MATASDIHSILYKGDILKPPEPKYDPTTKVKRYFRGKLPEFTGVENENDDIFEIDDTEESKELPVEESFVIHEKDIETKKPYVDKRLKLLEKLKTNKPLSDKPDNEELSTQPTRKRQREVIDFFPKNDTNKNVNEGLESDEKFVEESINTDSNLPKSKRVPITPVVLQTGSCDIEDRDITYDFNDVTTTEVLDWDRLRDKTSRNREKEEEEMKAMTYELSNLLDNDAPNNLLKLEDIDQLTDSSSSDYSDNEELFRPVFISNSKKNKEKSLLEDEELLQKTLEEESLKKKKEVKELLLKTIVEEQEEEQKKINRIKKGSWDPEVLINDEIDDHKKEYEAWKIREAKRYIRNREAKLIRLKFLAEIEKRRQMTDEEREEDNKRIDELKPKKEERTKYMFMQKYYHKGAFFQNMADSGEEKLYLRNYNVPIGEDTLDKSLLPKPLRVRRGLFGKAGQVKHTHLADVDTTDFTAGWTKNNIVDSNVNKKKGYKNINEFEKPTRLNK